MGTGGPQKVFSSVKSFSGRGKLLSKNELQTLAESRDLDELVTRIKNTTYGDSISKLTAPFTAEKIEALLRSHLADVHYSLTKSVGGSPLLNAYYLKFLIWNLKLIFKGKVLGRPYEEIESRVNLHAEELIGRRDIIVKALVAKDIEEAVSSLASSEFG
ncbi:MAG: V0D/AC39 family V-type ATPase subunit, partial [Nitrosopumilaceae archaeon]